MMSFQRIISREKLCCYMIKTLEPKLMGECHSLKVIRSHDNPKAKSARQTWAQQTFMSSFLRGILILPLVTMPHETFSAIATRVFSVVQV